MKLKAYLLAAAGALGIATSAHAANDFTVYFSTPQTDVTFQAVTNTSTLATAYSAANVAVASVSDDEGGVVSGTVDTLSSSTPFDSIVFAYNGGLNGPSATNLTYLFGSTSEDLTFAGETSGATIGTTYSSIGATFSGAEFLECSGGCPAPNPESGIFAYPNNSVNVAVPEPATWALMLAGFGLVGYALRKRVRTALAYS